MRDRHLRALSAKALAWGFIVLFGMIPLDAWEDPVPDECYELSIEELAQQVQSSLCSYKFLIESLNTEIAGLRYRLCELERELSCWQTVDHNQFIEECWEACDEDSEICTPSVESYVYPCYRGRCFSGEIWADALYWHPLFGGVEYATVLGSPSRVQEVDPEFDWGYKLGARIYLNCDRFYVGSEFFHYTQKSDQSVISPGNIVGNFAPVLAVVNAAEGKIESKYEAVDVTAGYEWICSSCWESFLFAGARYIFAKESESYLYDIGGTPTPAQQRMITSGWGPRIGADVKLFPFTCFRFLNTISLSGAFAFTGIIGKIRLETVSQSDAFDPVGALVDSPNVQFIPGLDMKLEARYSVCIMRASISVRGGYELHSYLDARERLAATNGFATDPPKTISSLGYGGPFFGLSISY